MPIPSVVDLGVELTDLIDVQAKWSQETFGADTVRGPIGALKHLEKEAKEAREAFELYQGATTLMGDDARKSFEVELADCLLLLLDATRRSGMTVRQLVLVAHEKMAVNRSRVWPKPTSDEPVEHVR